MMHSFVASEVLFCRRNRTVRFVRFFLPRLDVLLVNICCCLVGPSVLQLLPKIVGNVGFIFTNGELADIRDVIEEHRVPAPARVGSIAPSDVKVPPGPTGCDPGQTSFFQVLQVWGILREEA